jgi:hypothetical protein
MVFEGLVKVTTLPAIIISSAWIITSKGFVEGLAFLAITMGIYVFILYIFQQQKKEMEKLKKGSSEE